MQCDVSIDFDQECGGTEVKEREEGKGAGKGVEVKREGELEPRVRRETDKNDRLINNIHLRLK